MCPGQFPSPAPSRGPSPEPPARSESPSVSPEHAVTSRNFTASNSFRKRPRFADSQSNTLLSKHRHPAKTAETLQSRSSYKIERRRASDPLHSNARRNDHNDSDTIPLLHQQPLAASAQLQPSPYTITVSSDAPRSTSQPVGLSAFNSSRLIDINVRNKLREPLKSDDTQGTIYIVRDPDNYQRGIKIGWTKRPDLDKRIKEHRYTCKFYPKVINFYDVENSYRAEQLIHADLMDRKNSWTCTGHKRGKVSTHGEWFDISEQMARETVEKWVTFMNEQRPYGWTRTLNPLWSYLLRTRGLANLDNNDHEARRQQLYIILATPTRLDLFHSILDTFSGTFQTLFTKSLRMWSFCMLFFWQLLTVTYGFVTLLAFRNTFASSAFALVSVCAYISVAQPNLPRRLRSKS